MFKFKSIIGSFLASFLIFSACTPSTTQINTAKDAMSKINMSVVFAEAYITVAQAQYATNPKVFAALEATKLALSTVKSVLTSVEAGLSKDYAALYSASVVLLQRTFELALAIKEASSK